jgi:hypothetical protein
MGAADRAALALTRYIAGSRQSRWALLAYAAGLHALLVFLLVLAMQRRLPCPVEARSWVAAAATAAAAGAAGRRGRAAGTWGKS